MKQTTNKSNDHKYSTDLVDFWRDKILIVWICDTNPAKCVVLYWAPASN